MELVTLGLWREAEGIWTKALPTDFTDHGQDPVRSMKNDGVALNTLLRKAAERGGVDPLDLEHVASGYAAHIEQARSLSQLKMIMADMIGNYCRLVHRHSMKGYSLPVRKAIMQIKSDISANFTLGHLAQTVGVSSSYLSTLFKKETGLTITQYVTQIRIHKAKQLLEGTHLQVQAVAQHCGMVDRHYFSRIFKKETGMTPNQYRKSAR